MVKGSAHKSNILHVVPILNHHCLTHTVFIYLTTYSSNNLVFRTCLSTPDLSVTCALKVLRRRYICYINTRCVTYRHCTADIYNVLNTANS